MQFTQLFSYIYRKLAPIIYSLLILQGAVFYYFILTWYTLEDSFWFTALLANFIPIGLLSCISHLVFAIWRQYRIVLLWGIPSLLILINDYSSIFNRDNLMNSCLSPKTFTLLSHNIGQDLPDYNDIDALIQANNTDFVILQEITREYILTHLPKLNNLYPYSSVGPLLTDKGVGMAFFSKFPILQNEDFKLDSDGLVYQQKILVNLDNSPITFYNIHLTFPWIKLKKLVGNVSYPIYDDLVRRKEVENFVASVNARDNNIVAVGDFNFSVYSTDYKKITQILIDGFKQANRGLGLTWPANRTPSVNIPFARPIFRIDHLFHSKNIKTTSANILTKTGSDHLPQLYELCLDYSAQNNP